MPRTGAWAERTCKYVRTMYVPSRARAKEHPYATPGHKYPVYLPAHRPWHGAPLEQSKRCTVWNRIGVVLCGHLFDFRRCVPTKQQPCLAPKVDVTPDEAKYPGRSRPPQKWGQRSVASVDLGLPNARVYQSDRQRKLFHNSTDRVCHKAR